jgi:DNA-binding MarR family transcriptional regulator
MKDLVRSEDIRRLDKLYRLLATQKQDYQANIPPELRDLSRLDTSVLYLAAFEPDKLIREIAKKLQIPNSTLTSSLNRLEEKGIVQRTISSRDRRSFKLILTDKGADIIKAYSDLERSYYETILTKLDNDEERALLLYLLDKIVYQ